MSATFRMPITDFIERLRLPRDIKLDAVSIGVDQVTFTCEGNGELKLIQRTLEQREMTTWLSWMPALVPIEDGEP